MTPSEFHREIVTSVRAAAKLAKESTRNCYIEDVGNRLMDAEELADFHICQFVGIGERRRQIQIDGYSFDEADGSLALLIAQFSDDDRLLTFGAAEVRKNLAALKAFLADALAGRLTDGSVEESHPGFGLASDILRLQESIVRFRLYFVSDGQLTTRVQDWAEEEFDDIPLEYQVWDITRFHRAHESSSGRDELQVNFDIAENKGLPCLKAFAAAGEYQSYLCMISGEVLATIYERHGSRLLEGNVRSFLSTKGKVNTGIQTTIQDEPGMFFAYNNGVTATAEAVMFDAQEVGPKILRATNFQIVNGGQTTASLAAALRNGADLSNVFVQMKLSVLPSERVGELIPLIARFANSQNKVSDADFFANHPYHIRIEELSRRIWTQAARGQQHGTQWFYERARGQFANEQSKLKGSQKDKYLTQNPRNQLLTKTDIAKLENSWRGMPQKVSLGAQKNFLVFADFVAKRWKQNDAQFNEEYFRYLVVLAILFRHTETLLKNQPWYQGGYRANIVTYSLAKLQNMIAHDAKGRHLNIREIWISQSVPSAVSDQLAAIALKVFGVLTDPDRPKDNVTEWAKQDLCWKRVQELDISIDGQLLLELAAPNVQTNVDSARSESDHIEFGAYAKTAVMQFAGSQWDEMRRWAIDRELVNLREKDLLRAASRIPRFVPTVSQCEAILKIRQKLVSSGFC